MPTIDQASRILTAAGISADVVSCAIVSCRIKDIRNDHDNEIIFPWRTIMEYVATPALMAHIGATGINSPLWYALARNIARLMSEPHPSDTRALLLRDSRALWVSRGCRPEQWDLFLDVATGLHFLDISDVTK